MKIKLTILMLVALSFIAVLHLVNAGQGEDFCYDCPGECKILDEGGAICCEISGWHIEGDSCYPPEDPSDCLEKYWYKYDCSRHCSSSDWVHDYNSNKCCPYNYPYYTGDGKCSYVPKDGFSDNSFLRRSECQPHIEGGLSLPPNEKWNDKITRVDTKCEGYVLFKCQWQEEWIFRYEQVGLTVGECGVECIDDSDCPENEFYGDSCEGKEHIEKTKSYFCSNDYKCDYNINEESKGKVKGKCGVRCLEDSDCDTDKYVGETFCSSNKDVSKKYRDYYCNDSLSCQYNEIEKVVKTCSDICQEGGCINREWYEKPLNQLITSLVVLVTVIIGVIIYFKRKW